MCGLGEGRELCGKGDALCDSNELGGLNSERVLSANRAGSGQTKDQEVLRRRTYYWGSITSLPSTIHDLPAITAAHPLSGWGPFSQHLADVIALSS